MQHIPQGRVRRPLPSRERPARPAPGPVPPFVRTVGPVAVHVARWLRARPEVGRLWLALTLGIVGVLLVSIAAIADVYLHRGIETGAEQPYVVHLTGREPATNLDLRLFAPDQTDDVAGALQTAGFRYARHPFVWAEIEPERGDFSWDETDAIVETLTTHGIEPVAVLSGSPVWARDEAMRDAPDAPPANPADFGRFVGRFAERYGGRIKFFQLWDQPNRADRWGGVPSPGGYYRLLAEGSNAARTAFPDAKVVLAELAPTATGTGIVSDLEFLRALYDADSEPFFDVVAAQIDGGGRSPYDRRVNASRLNLSRAELYRELMVEHGDDATPIWSTRYGWRTGEGDGAVSATEQVQFTLSGLRRARGEWPWMGLMFAWDFYPRPDGTAGADAGYALLRADGTATPLFTGLAEAATENEPPVATTGYVPVHAPPLVYEGDWADQTLNGRTFITTAEIGTRATFRFRGTGAIAILRLSPDVGLVHATLDGDPLPGWPVVGNVAVLDLASSRARDVPIELVSGLDDAPHELTLTLAEAGQLTIGGAVVVREIPLMWPVVVLTVVGAVLLFVALRELVYAVATTAGYLQRRRGVDLWPAMPQLPEWRPSRRA